MRPLRGLVLSPIDAADTDEGWDGVGLWFDSLNDAKTAFASEPVRTLLAADRPRFLGRNVVFYATEHVIVPPQIR